MDIKKEGSLAAPTRDIVDWNSDEYLNEKALDAEMRRQFEVCHSCRRCFNLCDIWAISGIFFLEIKLFWYVNTTHLFDLFHT